MYICMKCKRHHLRWAGKCKFCSTFNEITLLQEKKHEESKFVKIKNVKLHSQERILSYGEHFDRVLGGGLVKGSAVLLCGPPGVGKSTLMLGKLCEISRKYNVAYVSGEETIQQISMRAERMNVKHSDIQLAHSNSLESLLHALTQDKIDILLLDSIQTIKSDKIDGASASITQVKNCSEALITHCKKNNITLILIGHITKDGAIAGPKILEHIVDVVLSLDRDRENRYFLLSSSKNRFGCINESAFFTMNACGLSEVKNPLSFFLEERKKAYVGNCIFPCIEGSKCIMIEIQTLLCKTYVFPAKRNVIGCSLNRLNMLCSIIERYCGIHLHQYDIFLNIGGGGKMYETSGDLAIISAILSSFYKIPLPSTFTAFGEISLCGESKECNWAAKRIENCKKIGINNFIHKGICENIQSIHEKIKNMQKI